MPGPSLFRRALPGVLLFGALLVTTEIASASTGTESIAESVADIAPDDEDGSSQGWGPIVGACLGVLFGGALAIWQIRGMRNRS